MASDFQQGWCAFYPRRAIYARNTKLTPTEPAQAPRRRVNGASELAPRLSEVDFDSHQQASPNSSDTFPISFVPSHLCGAFGCRRARRTPPPVVSVFSSTSLPRLLWQRLLHYYGLFRHLAPLRSASGLPLCFPIRPYAIEQKDARLPRVKRTPCERTHPRTHRRSGWESGFTSLRTLAHLPCRIRFTCVMIRSLPPAPPDSPSPVTPWPSDFSSPQPGRGPEEFSPELGPSALPGARSAAARRRFSWRRHVAAKFHTNHDFHTQERLTF